MMKPAPAIPKRTPKLRFPEFRKAPGWDADDLGEVADFVNEKIPLERIQLESYVSTENILADYGGVTRASKLPTTGSVTRYRPNDTLVSNIRPYLKKVWFADKEGGASNDVIVIRAKQQLLTQYFSCLLKNDAFIDYVMTGAKGVKMPRGDIGSMKEYPALYPSKPEQQKIAACLTSLNELIGAESQKLAALKAHKKGLMQQLFPREGETIPILRFPKFRKARAWRKRTISDILTKVSIPIEVEAEETYREIGVRSHGKGVFHKAPVNGAVIGDKRVFQVVEDALVLNIVFAWEQAVATTSKEEAGMIASHRFPMYVSQSGECDVRFIKQVFLTPLGKHLLGVASPGGAGRNRTLGQTEFERLVFHLPDTSEQTKVANIIVAVDKLITSQADKLEAIKAHKRGLMQQLFPSPDGY